MRNLEAESMRSKDYDILNAAWHFSQIWCMLCVLQLVTKIRISSCLPTGCNNINEIFIKHKSPS